jgi:hypothetical protein
MEGWANADVVLRDKMAGPYSVDPALQGDPMSLALGKWLRIFREGGWRVLEARVVFS